MRPARYFSIIQLSNSRVDRDLPDLQRVQQPVDAGRGGVCGSGSLQHPRDDHHRGRVHGNLLLCIQDHLPRGRGEEELSTPELRAALRGDRISII